MLLFAVPFNPKNMNHAFVKAFNNMKEIFSRLKIELIIIDCRFDDQKLLSEKVDSVLAYVDGIIFPGNPHLIDPRLYGEIPLHPERIDPEPKNYEFVELMINRAMEQGTPLLGICAGAWYLNVACGGSLKQEVIHFEESATNHDADPRDGRVVHQVDVSPNTLLSSIVNTSQIRVNSWHDHSIAEIGHGLRISAIAPDGVVEAIESDKADSFCMGIQFHPEYLLTGSSEEFLSADDIAKQQAIFSSMAEVAKELNDRLYQQGTFWSSSKKSAAFAYHQGNTEYLLNRFNSGGKLQFC